MEAIELSVFMEALKAEAERLPVGMNVYAVAAEPAEEDIPEGVDVHAVAAEPAEEDAPEAVDVHAMADELPIPPTQGTVPMPQRPVCPETHSYITVPYGWDIGNVLIRYGVSYQALAQANPDIHLEGLHSGVQLCIPPPGQPSRCQSDHGVSYMMRSHDTMDSVMRRFQITAAQLLCANPSMAPQDFVAGREICISM